MELRHLRYYEAVAAERNFTRAAERLGVAQPPLSRQIRELETEMGVMLFDRASRPVRLTEAGRVFHEQAAQVLAGVEQLRRSMARLTTSGRRRFAIGIVGSIVSGAMPGMIRTFRTAAPHVEVQLLELTTLEQVAALKDGRIDIGLGRLHVDDSAIRREVLYDEPLVAAVAIDHPLATRGTIALEDLTAETLIVYPNQPRPSYADHVLKLFRDRGLHSDHITEVREIQTALGLVAAQSGVAIVPASMQRIRRDDIVYLPIADPAAVSPIILSRREGDTTSENGLFEEICRTALHQHPKGMSVSAPPAA
jgi:DNA-binding transcriptional LysR family regulator